MAAQFGVVEYLFLVIFGGIVLIFLTACGLVWWELGKFLYTQFRRFWGVVRRRA